MSDVKRFLAPVNDTCDMDSYQMVVLASDYAALEAELAKLRAGQEPVEWRDVEGFEGLYKVSSNGDLLSLSTGKMLAKSLMGAGYVKASLFKQGKRTQTSVHRIVAQAFLDNPENFPNVNHINGVKTDNRVENLEWCNGSHDNLHRCYELGKGAYPIEAENIETGEVVFYPSITQAARDGFESSHIYRCIKGEIKQSNGWKFRRPATPQPSAAPDGWPLLERPARVGAGTFAAGLSARLVVEAAYRQHEYAVEPPFTDEQIKSLAKTFAAPSAPATVQGVNQQLLEALEKIADTDPDDGTAWFHEVANAAIAATRQEGGKV